MPATSVAGGGSHHNANGGSDVPDWLRHRGYNDVGQYPDDNTTAQDDKGKKGSTKCSYYLEMARSALGEPNLEHAYDWALKAKVANSTEKHAFDKELEQLFAELDKAVAQKLADADKLRTGGSPAEALLAYEAISKKFLNLPTGKKARQQFGDLQAAMRTGKFAQEAYDRLLLVIQDEWKQQGGQAPDGGGQATVDAVAVISGMAPERREQVMKQLEVLIRFCSGTTYAEQAAKLRQKLAALPARDAEPAAAPVASL